MSLDAARLHELFHYSVVTGKLTRRVAMGRNGRYPAGSEVGSFHQATGYLYTRVDGKLYLVHRLIWVWVTSAFPKADVDHENEVKTANYWLNLRDASRSENMQNVRAANANSSTGVRGVYARRGKFTAEIKLNGRKQFIGDFTTLVEATEARRAVQLDAHPFAPKEKTCEF